MAWKEALRRQLDPANAPDSPDAGETRDGESLMQQVRELAGWDGTSAAEPDKAHVRLADGYVRRSPVQPYYVSAGFRRGRVRKALLLVLGICFVVLLVTALLNSGILRFR